MFATYYVKLIVLCVLIHANGLNSCKQLLLRIFRLREYFGTICIFFFFYTSYVRVHDFDQQHCPEPVAGRFSIEISVLFKKAMF